MDPTGKHARTCPAPPPHRRHAAGRTEGANNRKISGLAVTSIQSTSPLQGDPIRMTRCTTTEIGTMTQPITQACLTLRKGSLNKEAAFISSYFKSWPMQCKTTIGSLPAWDLIGAVGATPIPRRAGPKTPQGEEKRIDRRLCETSLALT